MYMTFKVTCCQISKEADKQGNLKRQLLLRGKSFTNITSSIHPNSEELKTHTGFCPSYC